MILAQIIDHEVKLWVEKAMTTKLTCKVDQMNQILMLVFKYLKYADSHEWVKIDGNSATIGITDHAKDHFGDVVYVELPGVGATVTQGSSFGAVESVRATSDINSPVSGEGVEVNEELNSSPALLSPLLLCARMVAMKLCL